MKNLKLIAAMLCLTCSLTTGTFAVAEASVSGSAKLMAPVISANNVNDLAISGITKQINDSLTKVTKCKTVKKSKTRKDRVKEGNPSAESTFVPETGVGYVNVSKLNVRDLPSKNGEVVDTLPFNSKVKYETTEYSDWVTIGDDRYVCSDYLSDSKAEYRIVKAVSNSRKSFESSTVFGRNTRQQKLQNMAQTNSEGFRIVNGRFCIAVGSAVGKKVGTYIDVVLENDVVIPCVMGDQKDNGDTDSANQRTANGCVSEFIVETKVLYRNSKKASNRGDVSYAYDNWNSPVKEFHVYDKNILD